MRRNAAYPNAAYQDAAYQDAAYPDVTLMKKRLRAQLAARQSSGGALVLHVTDHHGDASSGAQVFVTVRDPFVNRLRFTELAGTRQHRARQS